MIVIDASAVLELILKTESANRIRDRIFQPEISLLAPHVIDLEVLQVLRRFMLAKTLTEAAAQNSLDLWFTMRVVRYAHQPLARRIFWLRQNFTAYDAAYIALAEANSAPLVTHDAKLARATGHFARVELI
ncbi:MAG TPA: VapC toxin family PIN domain ribonuclease [Alphaproteobacteria bacterium]|nr:VapC toxin family PIN domain ribonuclease [Alphaproteobacteria bacterium]HAJ46952.1 VapC toxin family PIN domain ribonuclease [Alphaproteobacteria bacterium]